MAEKNRPGQIIRLARAQRIAPETLVSEAVKEHGCARAAALALGVSGSTIFAWLARADRRHVRRTAKVVTPVVAEKTDAVAGVYTTLLRQKVARVLKAQQGIDAVLANDAALAGDYIRAESVQTTELQGLSNLIEQMDDAGLTVQVVRKEGQA